MITVIFKNFYNSDNDYHNPDAAKNLVNYIYRANENSSGHLPIYGYAVTFPPTLDSLARDMETLIQVGQNGKIITASEKPLIHFIISLDIPKEQFHGALFHFTDSVARLFADRYITCYSLHMDTEHPHFHYVLCTFSYLKNTDLLGEALKVGSSQAYKLIRSSSVKAFKEGKDWKITKKAVIDYVLKQSGLIS